MESLEFIMKINPIKKGEITGYLGPNGAAKVQLLK